MKIDKALEDALLFLNDGRACLAAELIKEIKKQIEKTDKNWGEIDIMPELKDNQSLVNELVGRLGYADFGRNNIKVIANDYDGGDAA